MSLSSGIISTIAGTGSAGFSGDNGPATSATLNNPWRVAVDTSGNSSATTTYPGLSLFIVLIGNVYVAEYGNNRIRKIVTVSTSSPRYSSNRYIVRIFMILTALILIARVPL